VKLSEDTVAALTDIAQKRGAGDLGDALLQALADELLLVNAHAEGSPIFIERPDKSIHELILE
jgi:hypothetical protein